MSNVKDVEGHPSVADSGLEGSAVDQPATGISSLSYKSTEGKTKRGVTMSANEMEGTITRTAVDRRGSDDSDDGNPDERRGSEDSLAAEGISMEKQDVENKEKQGAGLAVGGTKSPKSPATGVSGQGGYSVVGGAGSSDRRSSGGRQAEKADKSPAGSPKSVTMVGSSSNSADQDDVDDGGNHGLPFVAPITLEVGQVMFAPAPPPVSTAMPLLRSRSKDDDVKGGEAPSGTEAVEDIHEQYFDAVQLQNSSTRLSESGGEKNNEGSAKRKYVDAEEDADDEHVSSVSEGEEDHVTIELDQNTPQDDDTFPLRTYKLGRFKAEADSESPRDRLEERRLRLSSGDRLSVSSTGHDDGESSVLSDGYSPRLPHYRPPPDKNVLLSAATEADERASQSYNRFKASMPKFSSKAYSFSKRHPTSVTTVTTANTTSPLTFVNAPLSLLSRESQLYTSKRTTGGEDDVSLSGSEDGGRDNDKTPAVPRPPPPTPRQLYDDVKVDKSEGYYLDNYSDVCTWKLPMRDYSRPYLNGSLDETLEELLGKVDAEETKTGTNMVGQDQDSDIGENEETEKIDRDGEGGEGVRVEGKDDEDDSYKDFDADDDEKKEIDVKNEEDEAETEKVRILLLQVGGCINFQCE